LLENSPQLTTDAPVPLRRDGDRIEVDAVDLNRDLPAVLAWLAGQGVRYTGVRTQEASLESVFLHLTGRSLRD
jgi:hypothetical protein